MVVMFTVTIASIQYLKQAALQLAPEIRRVTRRITSLIVIIRSMHHYRQHYDHFDHHAMTASPDDHLRDHRRLHLH